MRASQYRPRMVAQANKEVLVARFKETQCIPEYCDEAWLLAQILTSLDAPILAQELRNIRQKIMREVEAQLDLIPLPAKWRFGPGSKSTRRKGVCFWKQIDITPEISRDPRMSGISVSNILARKLKKLIKEQIWLLKRYE